MPALTETQQASPREGGAQMSKWDCAQLFLKNKLTCQIKTFNWFQIVNTLVNEIFLYSKG